MSAHWFEAIADHLGAAYLRYSFTKGTVQEVGFLIEALGLQPGMRLLDVGCGPGRHSHALGAAGIEVVGVDVSQRFVDLAAAVPGGTAARFVRGDARRLPVRPGSFDAAISICQGGFGLVAGEDRDVVREMAAALRPGGRLALTAFSAWFAVRHLHGEGATIDPATGVSHEVTTVKDERGRDAEFDLWTSTFTPRELRWVCVGAGLSVDDVWAVAPGEYARNPPSLDQPEHLVVATKH